MWWSFSMQPIKFTVTALIWVSREFELHVSYFELPGFYCSKFKPLIHLSDHLPQVIKKEWHVRWSIIGKINFATYPNSFLSFICQLYYRPLLGVDEAQNLLSDPDRQAFFLMTNLRMVLVNFITASNFDPSSVPDSLKQSFYFAVSDWDVVASCFCNGQASQCDANVSCRVVTG